MYKELIKNINKLMKVTRIDMNNMKIIIFIHMIIKTIIIFIHMIIKTLIKHTTLRDHNRNLQSTLVIVLLIN